MNRALEVLDRLAKPLLGPFVPEKASTDVVAMRFCALRVSSRGTLAQILLEMPDEPVADSLDDAPLRAEQIVHGLLERLSPDGRTIPRAQQSRDHPDPGRVQPEGAR